MLHCLMPSSSTRRSNVHSSLPSQQGSSAEDTPRSSAQASPTFDLTLEYALAVRTNSYNEIWFKLHPSGPSYEDPNAGQENAYEEQQLLAQILNPSPECIQGALQHARLNTLTRLISAYFDHSENASHLCLLLQYSVHHARFLYHNLHNLLVVLPLDSDSNFLTQSQCDRAFDVFLQFDCLDNPFRPGSHNFNDMRHCCFKLKQQLHHQLHKSRSRIRLLRRPLLPAFLSSKITKKKMAHLAQLEAAAMGNCVLHNHLGTIDCLVKRFYAAVEDDKFLIRLGLESGRGRHPIHAIAKQLQKNRHNFLSQLMDLEQHICLFFTLINRARSHLLREIPLHQSHYS